MNERVPDSSGLPLRAIVMVLLFLGVIFLLAALYALGPNDDGDDTGSVATITTSASPTSAPPETEEPAPARAEVRVFNISEVAGAADRAATRLRDAEWNVTEVGNLTLPDVPATTVYFGNAEGEQASAEEVGRLLEAQVEPRIPAPEIADQPPGVIVVVTG